jgi:hypothetical protein
MLFRKTERTGPASRSYFREIEARILATGRHLSQMPQSLSERDLALDSDCCWQKLGGQPIE